MKNHIRRIILRFLFGKSVLGANEDTFQNFENPGGGRRTVVGADLASASTLPTPTNLIHRVTGTAAIDTIPVPYPGFEGMLILWPTGASSITAAGNIAKAQSFTANVAVLLVYSQSVGKWGPGAIS